MGLAIPTEKSVLYRSREHFGLQFKDVRQLSRQLQVVKCLILKYSKDPSGRQLYKYMLKRSKAFRKFPTSLRKPPRTLKRIHQLPAPLDMEQAERNLKFSLVKGSTSFPVDAFVRRDLVNVPPIYHLLNSTDKMPFLS